MEVGWHLLSTFSAASLWKSGGTFSEIGWHLLSSSSESLEIGWHLLSTFSVLADGEIEDAGTHVELVTAGGRYAELFDLQAAGFR